MDIIDLWKLGDALFVEVCFCLISGLKLKLVNIIFTFIQKTHGLILPDWARDNFKRITDSLRWGFYFDYRTVEMARLFAGKFHKFCC